MPDQHNLIEGESFDQYWVRYQNILSTTRGWATFNSDQWNRAYQDNPPLVMEIGQVYTCVGSPSNMRIQLEDKSYNCANGQLFIQHLVRGLKRVLL